MSHWQSICLWSFGVFAVALLIALFQGGALSTGGGDVNASAFSFWFNGRTEYHTHGFQIAFWNWRFLRDFGLPLLLVPFFALHFWRKRSTSTFPLFLLILALGHLATPFFVHYQTLPGELKRLFTHAISLFALLAGIWLEQTLLESRTLLHRILGYAAIVTMLIAGVLYAAVRLAFPTFRFEAAPLFAQIPAVTAQENDLYAWVRSHSTIDDYFYLFTLDDRREESISVTRRTEAEGQQLPRIRFMTYTGRHTIGPILSFLSLSDARFSVIRRFERTCRTAVADALQIRFIVVETANRAKWFRTRCRGRDWKKVYQGAPQEADSPRVYERE